MNDRLVGEEDLIQSYNNYKKAVSNVKDYHKKISTEDYGDTKKLISVVKQYEKSLNNLLRKMKNFENTDTLNKVNEELEKVQEDADEKVKEIKEKLEQTKVDMNIEIGDKENQENESNEGMQVQVQEQTDLFQTQEYLEKRRKELQNIHVASAMIADTAKKIKEDLAEQGEVLDKIEANVDNAQKNVDKAGKEINKANEYSKGNNRRISVFIGIIVIAVGIALAIVLSIVLNRD